MVALAGFVADVPNMDRVQEIDESHRTYAETEEEKEKPAEFLFENYPIAETSHSGAIADVDFSTNPLAKNFEEIIAKSVTSIGPNFAGIYSIATWSCGPLCQNSAIVDVRDGSIHTYGVISAYGLSYSKESTLLIINPPENVPENEDTEEPRIVETDYYSITDDELVFEGKKLNGEEIIEDCIQAIANARNKITNEIVAFPTPCKVPFGWELVP